MIIFPSSPSLGQEYVGANGATYTWLGNRWNSGTAIQSGSAKYCYEGGDAYTWNNTTNNSGDVELDGGTS